VSIQSSLVTEIRDGKEEEEYWAKIKGRAFTNLTQILWKEEQRTVIVIFFRNKLPNGRHGCLQIQIKEDHFGKSRRTRKCTRDSQMQIHAEEDKRFKRHLQRASRKRCFIKQAR
ncbi:hypothetical protein ROZALSC1DRAFT_30755, partial [Rozella allomycis CSF55]